MSLFNAVTSVETNDDFHLARLLLLIDTFSGAEGKDAVEGITKLAKLDFLLRYPSYLERALERRQTNPRSAGVRDFERDSVESSMVRFKYGPWDFRYRRFLNLLVGKGLVHVYVQGRTVHISVTAKGNAIAERLRTQEQFGDLSHRSRLLKTHLDLSATTLMKFIYETFPELGNMRFGTVIGNEL